MPIVRVLVVLACLIVPGVARAQPSGGVVALLPLDADQRLELYGQPVASEIARVLVAGGIDVVVVGPKMAVPERARLVVDGTITVGKADAVALAVRIRDRATGSVLDKLEATAPALTAIDRAAAELSSRVLPAVQARLAAATQRPVISHDMPKPVTTAAPPTPAPPAELTVKITAGTLHDALHATFTTWAERHHRTLVEKTGMEHAELALEPFGYTVEQGAVPMARARVRVRISDGDKVLFERIVVTDTVVGDKQIKPDDLQARVAREVLAILEPHYKRVVPALWQP